jgi:hypothetical protein
MDKGGTMIQKVRVNGKASGYLVAFPHPDHQEVLLVGYAACHPKKERQYCRGEAMRLARERALVLAKRLGHWRDRKINKVRPNDTTWPWAVLEALPQFAWRCSRYYKGTQLVPWAQSLLDDPPTISR